MSDLVPVPEKKPETTGKPPWPLQPAGPAGLHGDPGWLSMLAQTGTPDLLQRLEQHVNLNALGPVQPSIICKGDKCPFYQACFLRQENVPLPVGSKCPIEETFKHRWAKELGAVLGKGDDGYLAIDLGLLIDIINTNLDIHRAQSELVAQPAVAERTFVGLDPQGRPIIDLKMNPVVFALRHSRKLKTAILEQMVATKEARLKDKSRQTEDAAKLYERLAKVIPSIRQSQASPRILLVPQPEQQPRQEPSE